MPKNNVSASDSLTSATSSTTSVFGGTEGAVFDEFRSARIEIERGWTFFKSIHRRVQKEGRIPANAEDRRDCEILQINLAMQLNDFVGHIKGFKSEWPFLFLDPLTPSQFHPPYSFFKIRPGSARKKPHLVLLVRTKEFQQSSEIPHLALSLKPLSDVACSQ